MGFQDQLRSYELMLRAEDEVAAHEPAADAVASRKRGMDDYGDDEWNMR